MEGKESKVEDQRPGLCECGEVAVNPHNAKDPRWCAECWGKKLSRGWSKRSNIDANEHGKTKVCRLCGEELPIEEFHRNKGCVGGRESRCRECKRKKRNEQRMGQRTTSNQHATPALNAPDTLAVSKENSLVIDFADYGALLEQVRQKASEDVRTPELQVLYMLKTAIAHSVEAEKQKRITERT